METSADKVLAGVLGFVLLLTPAKIFSAVEDQPASETLLLSNIHQLTFVGRRSGEGYFDATGTRLVFQSEREPDNPFFQIYSMDLKTGDTRRLSPGFGKATCAWTHPGGRKVLFASTHEDPEARAEQEEELELRASGKSRRYSWDFDDAYEIYEMDLESESLKNLTQALGYDAEASWSPDGRRIVFASNRHAYAGEISAEDQKIFGRDKSYLVDLYIMQADGTHVQRLTETKGYDGGPFFSSDGREICWRRFSEDGSTAEIYIMDLHSLKKRQVTRLGVMSWAPYFHPSGEYLIFVTNLHGFDNFELYIVDAQGLREPVRVTDTAGFDGLPAFSPDGTQLVWTSNRGANNQSQLFVARWNHRKARELLGLAGVSHPSKQESNQAPAAADGLEATTPDIRAADLRLHLEYLSSREMAGRLTGTAGARRAGEYVASAFRSLGLEPAGDGGTYFQAFEFTAGVSLGPGNRLAVLEENAPGKNLVVEQNWRPLAFSGTGEFGPAPVVFAGYGIAAPGAEGLAEYDSYVHLNVTDKWVLVFRYVPEGVSPELRRHLLRHSGLRYKAMVARDRGARGLILVSGPNSKVKEELVPLSMDASVAAGSIAVLSVTDRVAREWIERSGKTLKDLQDRLDHGEPVMGFEISELRLKAVTDIRQEKRTGANVLARLRAPQGRRTSVILGAHLDHLGDGQTTGSLAREDEQGSIHYGADDNASGVAAMLEIAQYLAHLNAQGELPMKRDLILAAWSGEELGLLGSNHFVDTRINERDASGLPPEIAAYLNLDMVGRLEGKLVLQGIGSSTVWLEEIERSNAPVGLPLAIQNETYLPTDTTAFYLKGVPILSVFTGAHEDYHTPRDTAEKINYAGTREIAHLTARITASLLAREEAPGYQEMRKPEHFTQRAHLRAYLGTVPDYSEEGVLGVKLSGVAKGGPADQAGVTPGDVIVELAGKKIENIYDYTYAIEALTIGEAVKMVVIRDGERLSFPVVPGSRE